MLILWLWASTPVWWKLRKRNLQFKLVFHSIFALGFWQHCHRLLVQSNSIDSWWFSIFSWQGTCVLCAHCNLNMCKKEWNNLQTDIKKPKEGRKQQQHPCHVQMVRNSVSSKRFNLWYKWEFIGFFFSIRSLGRRSIWRFLMANGQTDVWRKKCVWIYHFSFWIDLSSSVFSVLVFWLTNLQPKREWERE